MSDPFLLSDKREWWGRWWLPDSPTEYYAGVLEFHPEAGAVLRMVGGFEYHVFEEPVPGMRTYGGETRDWPVVHGVAENREITLLETRVSHAKSYNFADPDTLHIRARTILIGCHLEELDTTAFIQSAAGIENLAIWCAESAVTGQLRFKEGTKELSGVGELIVAPVAAKTVSVGDWTIGLRHRHTLPHVAVTRHERVGRVRDMPFIDVDFREPVNLNDALDPLAAIRDLLSLAMSDNSGFIWQRVFLPPVPDSFPADHPLANEPRAIEVIRRQQLIARPDGHPADGGDILFTLDDIPFDAIVPRWFEVRQRFQAPANMILGLRYGPGANLETQVTTTVGAAEAMHRALDPASPIPEQEFSGIRKALLKAIPKEHRSWLASLLQRNEPTLRSRLLDLVDRLPAEIAAAILPEPRRWADRAKDARNDLAHTGESGRHTLEELYAVAEVADAIVVLTFLEALQVPRKSVADRMVDNRRLGRAARLARRFFADSPSAKQ